MKPTTSSANLLILRAAAVKKPKKILAILCALGILAVTVFPPNPATAQTPAWAWPDQWLADNSIFNVWSRTDAPVAMQAASRSWLWGPAPFAVANEPYAESPTGLRLVQYFDKGRMEINNPRADRSSPWFVTSGLLVSEMVTGQYQTGNSTFLPLPPADLPVAGDAFSPDAPTYASFANHLTRAVQSPIVIDDPNLLAHVPSLRLNRDGTLTPLSDTFNDSLPNPDLLSLPAYDQVTGHNIPRVFTDWMAQRGPILSEGRLGEGDLIDPLYLLGHPITEPYWADIRIDGQPATVLVQLYERRALTYNPNNPDGWQVEMANVGRAYYDWLYREAFPTPAIAVNSSATNYLNATTKDIAFHGYNWPPHSTVTLRIALADSPDPFLGPLTLTTNAEGQFTSILTATLPLQSAQLALADIRAYAEGGGISMSLPFPTPYTQQPIPISGTIVGIEAAEATGTYTLTISSFPTRAHVLVTPSTQITFAEGTLALPSDLSTNTFVTLFATQPRGSLVATDLQLLSLSRSGAWVGYEWTDDNQHLHVTGASWPPSSTVSFNLYSRFSIPTYFPQPNLPIYYGPPPDPFATLQTDSRGNLLGTIASPPITTTLLIEADVQNSTQVTHPISPDYAPNGSGFPDLTLISSGGMQEPTYFCFLDCGDYFPPPPLPSFALPAALGETLALRTWFGPNPSTGISPNSYSLELHPLPADQILPGTDPISDPFPDPPPVYSLTSPTGTPFAITLPQTLPSGRYILYLTVHWSIPSDPDLTISYIFVIHLK